jgi:hypothetical protein
LTFPSSLHKRVGSNLYKCKSPVYKHGLLCSFFICLFSFLKLVFFYFFFLPRPMQQLRDGGVVV